MQDLDSSGLRYFYQTEALNKLCFWSYCLTHYSDLDYSLVRDQRTKSAACYTERLNKCCKNVLITVTNLCLKFVVDLLIKASWFSCSCGCCWFEMKRFYVLTRFNLHVCLCSLVWRWREHLRWRKWGWWRRDSTQLSSKTIYTSWIQRKRLMSPWRRRSTEQSVREKLNSNTETERKSMLNKTTHLFTMM